MNALLAVLKAVDELGAGGQEFGSTAVLKKTGLSPSQNYGWLHVLKGHGFVTARLEKATRPQGDWRWKRQFRIVKLRKK